MNMMHTDAFYCLGNLDRAPAATIHSSKPIPHGDPWHEKSIRFIRTHPVDLRLITHLQ